MISDVADLMSRYIGAIALRESTSLASLSRRSADVRTCVAFLLETVEFLPSWKPHELVGLVQGRRVARTGTRAHRIPATCRDCPSLSSILFYFYLITRSPGDHIVHTRFSCVPRREIGIFAEIFCRKARITISHHFRIYISDFSSALSSVLCTNIFVDQQSFRCFNCRLLNDSHKN